MAGLLNRTMREWASTPCAPFPCGEEVWRYACAVAQVPMPALPPHRSARAVARLLHRHGGLVNYAAALITSLGWQEVEAPERGDVGVVHIPGMGLTCAICLSGAQPSPPRPRLWAARGSYRVLTIGAEHVRAWRQPCPAL